MASYYYNDNDDYFPEYKNQNQENIYDVEKEESRMNSLNVLQLAEYKSRQRRLMAHLEEVFDALPGFTIKINKNREWGELTVYRISKPKYIWVKNTDNIYFKLEVPGQCVTDVFQISLQDMHSLYVEVLHIIDQYGCDLYDISCDYYPEFAKVKPDKLVDIMLEFQN
jgi:hypothetical protein